MHLEIDRSNLRNHRIVESAMPITAPTGCVVLALERFALTSNNISYAMSGDALDYWGFFPATQDGWGCLPTMGFGVVVASDVDGINEGNRYFGFYPAGDHHVVHAEATSSGFVDVAAHREAHAMAYRGFDKVSDTQTAKDNATLVLRGLFVTSFLAEDFLRESEFFGAKQVLVTSASSKTSIALAHCLRLNSQVNVVGLTSAGNVDFTDGLDLYHQIITYDDIDTLDATVPTVSVDMAGNASVNSRIHHHFNDALMYSCRIGGTHWDQTGSTKGLPGPRPEFFFAPSQMAKRGKEWGRDVFNERINTALSLFLDDSTRWLTIEHSRGAEALVDIYDQLVNGRVRPEVGHILSL